MIASVMQDMNLRFTLKTLSTPVDVKQLTFNIEIGTVHMMLSPEQLVHMIAIIQGFTTIGKNLL